MSDPISNGDNGRDPKGRFVLGNPGGPGNPRSQQARQLRQRLDEALFKVCAPDRLTAVIDAILKLAEAGDVSAAKLLFERISGPPTNVEITERIERLEHVKFNPITLDGDRQISDESEYDDE